MSQSPFNLDGQVVLVSGAGRGIGRAAAELIAQMGARVAITSRTVAQVEEVAQAIRDDGGQAWAFRSSSAASGSRLRTTTTSRTSISAAPSSSLATSLRA